MLMQAALEAQLSVPRTHSLMSTSQLGPSNLHNQAVLKLDMKCLVAKVLSQGGPGSHNEINGVSLLLGDMDNSSKHVWMFVMLCFIRRGHRKPLAASWLSSSGRQETFYIFWKQNTSGNRTCMVTLSNAAVSSHDEP